MSQSRPYIIVTLLLALLIQFQASATGEAATPADVDSIEAQPRKSLINRVIDYFGKANIPNDDGKLEVSFIGGPHYSSDTKLGLGIVSAARYGRAYYSSDSTRRVRSESALFLDLTTSGCVEFGARGTHIFPNEKRLINYELAVSNFPSRFWGIGFNAGKYKDGYTKFDQVSFIATASFEWQVFPHLFLGPSVNYSLISARKVKDRSFWQGQPASTSSLGLGGVLTFDSRDNITAPRRGWLARLEVLYYPSMLGRPDKSFTTFELTGCHYLSLWRDATMALRAHAMMTTGAAPWSMLATFGGSYSMRGYYEGRFRDKDEVDVVAELRQRVWKRSGVVVWVGAGTVFPRIDAVRWRKVLPNAGIGYRWEFKKNSNVRVDFGFGRGETGFIFNINEAF